MGGGIVGATVAAELVRRGADVTIVERGDLGSGATSVGFSWINAADKSPRHYADLNLRGLASWALLEQRYGDIGVTRGGELRWAVTETGAAALRKRAELHQAAGYPVQLLSPAEAVALEPVLADVAMAAASYSELEGHLDADVALRRFAELVVEGGGAVRTGCRPLEVVWASPDARRVQAVVTDNGSVLPCDTVIVAAGADATEVGELFGVHVPIRTSFGATVVTTPLSGPLAHRVAVLQTARDADCRVSVRQLRDGRAMLHGLGTGEGSLGKTDAEVEQVLETARAVLPCLRNVEISEVRRGSRPMPEDGLPVVGYGSSPDNVYVMAMHNAITLAPAIAAFAALEVLDGARVDVLRALRPSRFVKETA